MMAFELIETNNPDWQGRYNFIIDKS